VLIDRLEAYPTKKSQPGRCIRLVSPTSALSNLDFGIDGLEFAAGVVDLHLPIDASLGVVDVG
jgi:hypothetical protein